MLNKVREVLYVGVGSGFVPAYLRAQGVSVTTVDVNPALNPDILSDINCLSKQVTSRFEAVMACEVLEHLPLAKLQSSIQQLSLVTLEKLLVTLPVYQRFPFKLCGTLKLCGREIPFGVWLPWRKQQLPRGHLWEVNSLPACSVESIVGILSQHFATCNSYRMRLNPYHQIFECALQPN